MPSLRLSIILALSLLPIAAESIHAAEPAMGAVTREQTEQKSFINRSALPPGHPNIPVGHPMMQGAHPKTTHPDITLFELIAGGIAGHRGQMQQAYEFLSDAASREKNAKIAGWAWEAAAGTRDPAVLLRAADLWLSFDPKAEMALQTKLAEAIDRQDRAAMDAVLTQMDKALSSKKDPSGWLERLLQAFVRTKQSGLSELAEALSPYVQKYGSRPSTAIAWAQLQLAAGNGSEACSLAQTAIKKSPNDAELLAQAADVCWRVDVKRAQAMLERFLQRHPDNAGIRLVLGRSQQRLGEHDKALASLKRALQHPSSDPKTYFNAGQLAADLNDPALTEQYLKTYVEMVRKENPDIDLSRLEVWMQLGNAALMQNAPERAVEYYSELTVGPLAVQALLRKSIALVDAKRPEDARRELIAGRANAGVDEPQLWRAEANLLMEENRPAEALEVMKAAAAKFPQEPEVLYDAAMIAEAAGSRDAAEKLLLTLLDVSPDHIQGNNALGYLYADENRRLSDARKLLEKAYSAAPLDPFILDSMGWLCYREGRYKAAFEFTRASLKRLDDPEVRMHLVRILKAAGRTNDAQAQLDELVKTAGITEDVRKLAQELSLMLPETSAPTGLSEPDLQKSPK